MLLLLFLRVLSASNHTLHHRVTLFVAPHEHGQKDLSNVHSSIHQISSTKVFSSCIIRVCNAVLLSSLLSLSSFPRTRCHGKHKSNFPSNCRENIPGIGCTASNIFTAAENIFCHQTIIEFAVFTAGLPPHVFWPADVAQLLPMTRWPEAHYTNSQQGGVYIFHTADVQTMPSL